MQKEKIRNLLKKISIFQEVNFYQASHYQEIKAAHNQQTELTKVDQIYLIQI